MGFPALWEEFLCEFYEREWVFEEVSFEVGGFHIPNASSQEDHRIDRLRNQREKRQNIERIVLLRDGAWQAHHPNLRIGVLQHKPPQIHHPHTPHSLRHRHPRAEFVRYEAQHRYDELYEEVLGDEVEESKRSRISLFLRVNKKITKGTRRK